MHPRMPILVALLALALTGDANAGNDEPNSGLIIARAQNFVLEHFRRPDQHFFDVAFDLSHLHPQSEPRNVGNRAD